MTATLGRTLLRTLPLVFLAAAGIVPAADAQTLGEIAKAEAARRAAVKNKGHVITDKDIKPAAPQVQAAPRPDTASETAAPDVPAGATGTPGAEGDAVPEPMKPRDKRDEAYWRKRFAETRDAVGRAQQDAADVQARIQAIDLEMQDSKLSPARRSELNVEKEGALTALKRFNQDAANLAAELAKLEQRAKDAKIDPAWTR
jgi:hypothetical protein